MAIAATKTFPIKRQMRMGIFASAAAYASRKSLLPETAGN